VTAETSALVTMRAPAACAASANVRDTVPMPPRAIIHVPSEPGSRHMLCTRKLWPVPGSSGPAFSPDRPSVTAYMLISSSLLNPNRDR
jgi:hypothetical protein